MEQNPAVQSYVIEARDLLAQLETMLLDLETRPEPETIDAVFRALHTLKGGGAMFGFRALADFVHHFEDAFDFVRDGKIGINRDLLDASLAGRDHMIALLAAGGDGGDTEALVGSAQAGRILSDLQAAVATAPPPEVAALRTWHVAFRPPAGALHNGLRPDLLLAELAELGPCQVRIDASALPALEDLDPGECHLSWAVEMRTTQPRSALEAVFIFADDCDLTIALEREDHGSANADDRPAHPVDVPADPTRRAQAHTVQEFVRVPAQKLDLILDQLGELVIAQARLGQIAARVGDSTLNGLVEEFTRLTTGLRDTTLAVRMLQIETVFGKFRRVVRDLSVELGKEVRLETEGGQTEIDKNVLDRLSEPLVHMIRNSVDHGIEDASERIAKGKPPVGTVRLSACQDAGEILIEISDDGRGLDLERIRAKALASGLLSPDAQPTASQLSQLIFAPGFSTAEKVSSVSGRGVGMDAVMSTITALRGTIDVTSVPCEGTRISLRLPLTLAIIDGLLVRLADDIFVLPLVSVEECAEFDTAELARQSGRSMLSIRENLVPFVDLRAVFAAPDHAEHRRRVVIVRAEGERMGLVVDDILGQHQTVIKQMSPYHAEIEGFAGSTILGDGRVALIIDVATLLRDLKGRSRRRAA